MNIWYMTRVWKVEIYGTEEAKEGTVNILDMEGQWRNNKDM